MISEIMMKVVNRTPLTQAEKDELSVYFNQSQAVTSKISGLQRVDELSYDLGDMIAGRFISPSDPNNNNPDSSTFTGTYMDENGVTGKNSGTTQFQLSSSTGKVTAGAGALTMDADGVTIYVPSAYDPVNSYKFVSGSDIASSYSIYDGGSRIVELSALASASNINTNFYIWSDCPSGKKSYTYIRAEYNNDGAPAEISLENGSSDSDRKVTINSDTITFNGTPTGNITSGTYTPTLNNTTNVSASTAYACQYMRVGGVVTVSGMVNIDPTAAGQTVLTMSLPVSSNLANDYELAGTGTQDITVTNMTTVLIRGSAANDVAVFVYNAISTAAQNVYFHFTYKIS